MKRRAVLLIIVFICLLSTADAAWITYSSGEQEIQSGDVTFLY